MKEFIVINLVDIVIAVIIDFILGDPYGFPHPIIFIGKLIKVVENRIRVIAKNDSQLKWLGGVMVIMIILVCFLVPSLLLMVAWKVKILFHIINIFFIWTTIAAKCLKDESMKVYNALADGDIPLGRKYTSYIVGRETKDLNEKELLRATVETIAENTSDGVIAPLFYCFLGGAPLAMIYKGVNTMDSMVGYVTEPYTYIGFFPAKVDDVFNYIPARITGIFMCCSSIFMKGDIVKSFRIMIRDRKNHKSPNCAYPEGAVAGILGVQLGGNNTYFGQVLKKPTIGDKNRELLKEDIIQTNKIMLMTQVLFLFVGIIVILLLGGVLNG